jgi:hypothetical protein
MMSIQLYTHDHRKSALNLIALQPGVFTAKDQAVGAMLATHAATALIAHDRERQFQAALSSRDVIGQAKGMIMNGSPWTRRGRLSCSKNSRRTPTPLWSISPPFSSPADPIRSRQAGRRRCQGLGSTEREGSLRSLPHSAAPGQGDSHPPT